MLFKDDLQLIYEIVHCLRNKSESLKVTIRMAASRFFRRPDANTNRYVFDKKLFRRGESLFSFSCLEKYAFFKFSTIILPVVPIPPRIPLANSRNSAELPHSETFGSCIPFASNCLFLFRLQSNGKWVTKLYLLLLTVQTINIKAENILMLVLHTKHPYQFDLINKLMLDQQNFAYVFFFSQIVGYVYVKQ